MFVMTTEENALLTFEVFFPSHHQLDSTSRTGSKMLDRKGHSAPITTGHHVVNVAPIDMCNISKSPTIRNGPSICRFRHEEECATSHQKKFEIPKNIKIKGSF